MWKIRQKTYSDIKPEKRFSIENIENGSCTVLFFDNIQEEDNSNIEKESNKKLYSYDIYSLEITYRDKLAETIEANIDEWINEVKEKDYNEMAAYIRKERDSLLYATDKYIIEDYPISEEYREKLRDIPEQEGFPYNVAWPTKSKD